MKSFLLLLLMAPLSYAASCCVGGGPKSFIQLRNFEKYQLGLLVSYKDNYAKYNPYGSLVETKKKETLNSSLGAGIKLREDWDASLLVPFTRVEKRSGLGDLSLGTRLVLLDPLFLSDWYPKLSLNLNLKFPTGTEEKIDSSGNLLYGTGNGIWEPTLSFLVEKDYRFLIVNLGVGYTYRSVKEVSDLFSGKTLSVKEGDRFELTEALIFPLTESLSFGFGASQIWELATQINAQGINDTHGRSVQGVLSSTYFFSRLWKLTLGLESTVPIEGWGTTLQASRSCTLTSLYSFY